MTAAPAAIMAEGRHAAGNRLGPAPCRWVRLRPGGGPLPAEPALVAWLAEVDADLALEFAATPVEPAGAAAFVARIMAAMMPVGRSLAIAVVAEAGGTRLVLVEAGKAQRPGRVAALAVRMLAAAAAGEPAAGFRTLVAETGAPAVKPIARYGSTLIPARLAARGVPCRESPGQTALLIGEGAGTRPIRFSIGPDTGALAGELAERKDHTAAALAHFGLPVPRQLPAADGDAAVLAADRIGYPVVVKPVDRSGGAGVTAGLSSADAVRAAFATAAAVSGRIAVEAMLPGDDHRLTVIDGRLVAATRKVPARVLGDGTSTVAALVERTNADPLRIGSRSMLMPIRLGPESERVLAASGWACHSVPPAGCWVDLHSAANISQGARPVDVTAIVHPDNAAAARHATAVVGLDMAGIDFISPDIARSWREIGGGICDVNRLPGLLVHHVAEGTPDVASDMVAHMAGAATPATIPIVVLLGGGDADRRAGELAGALAGQGRAVGLATGAGLVAAGLALEDPGIGDPRRLFILAADPAVTAVVAVVPPTAILDHGLGHVRADLAILPDPASPAAEAAASVLARIGAEVMSASALADGRALQWVGRRYPIPAAGDGGR